MYESKPDITKIRLLKNGNAGITVFACGLEVQECLEAAGLLENDGIDITVVDVLMIKPCSKDEFIDLLKDSKVVFSVEKHNVIGGLGSMLTEYSCEYFPRAIHRIGVQDRFGQTGTASEIFNYYRLDAVGIYQQVKSYVDNESR